MFVKIKITIIVIFYILNINCTPKSGFSCGYLLVFKIKTVNPLVMRIYGLEGEGG